ncbi:hypothetical protein MAPG_07509 [Magnaporthiopsis poae ATCC 64411]|uniref:DUF1772 domain-containing protein n=1 Tax=Magnaporthiopsis poae (strain ATCC 64411 / 73-15) TaxID=644358 RepID=A0A0C4E4V6_MAGP6|nr:hypothetical protein MAPG_07509 [Magnaporthiopsis poae ATCC 64411]
MMPSSIPSAETTKALQAASLFAVSAASGATLGLSFFVVPTLLEAPTPLMLHLWERTLLRGRNILAPIDLLSSLGFASLAIRLSRAAASSSSVPSRCYGAAAVLAASVVPYTLLVVMPTNRKLLRRTELARALGPAAAAAAADDDDAVRPADEPESSKSLVDHWGMLNLGRSALLLVSAALGFYASSL